MRKHKLDSFRCYIRGFGVPYWLFVAGQCLANAADKFLSVAIAAFTYSLTGSALAYAVQMLVGFLPSVLLSGIAGRTVDRLNRRRVMIVADICGSLAILFYPFCRTPGAIYALNAIRSVTFAFSVPARIALMPELTGKERLVEANGLRTALGGAVSLLAPVLAGALVDGAGPNAGFVAASIAVLGSVGCWASLPRTTGSRAVSGRSGKARGPRSVGTLRQMSADPVLIGTVVIFSVYSAGASGTNAIYYPFVTSVLHAGPWFFGLATSLYFGANLVGGLIIARYRRARLPLLGLAAAAAVLWGGIAVFRNTAVLLSVSFGGGLLYSLVSTVYESTIQLRAPAGLTGQTASVSRAVTSAAQVVGMLFCGLLAERLGPVLAYRWAFLGGTALVLATGLALRQSNSRGRAAAPQSAD